MTLQVFQWRHVLHGDNDRLYFALLRNDGRGVDQRRDFSAIGHLEYDFLGPDSCSLAQQPYQRVFLQFDFTPVRTLHVDLVEQIHNRHARCLQVSHDAARLLVERHGLPGPRVEHRDTDG